MHPKTIFITGASGGLGKAVAILFAKNGWKVIATMRYPKAETELGYIPGICALLPMDVTDQVQIEEAVAIALESGTVDVVFNNAGYGIAGPLEGISGEEVFRLIDTNLLGVIRVTQAFLPSFRERKKGLFITTTALGGHITVPFNAVYHASKWALEGWSESMNFEMNPFSVFFKTIAPGCISTEFAKRSLVFSRHKAYEKAFKKMLSLQSSNEVENQSSTPEDIAEVVYEAATDGSQQHRYLAGMDAKALYIQRATLGDEVFRRWIRDRYLEVY